MLSQMTKEKEKLEQALLGLAAERFACEHDAQDRLTAWSKQQKWKWHTVDLSVDSETVILLRAKRGRPKAHEAPQSAIQ